MYPYEIVAKIIRALYPLRQLLVLFAIWFIISVLFALCR
jgi:hypothetical protein